MPANCCFFPRKLAYGWFRPAACSVPCVVCKPISQDITAIYLTTSSFINDIQNPVQAIFNRPVPPDS